jgi:hypothetical protein
MGSRPIVNEALWIWMPCLIFAFFWLLRKHRSS